MIRPIDLSTAFLAKYTFAEIPIGTYTKLLWGIADLIEKDRKTATVPVEVTGNSKSQVLGSESHQLHQKE